MKYCTGWHWMADAEVVWTRWGLGVEFSFGHWMPREWSAYLHIGPVLLWAGCEKCHEPIGDEHCFYCERPYAPPSQQETDR